MVSVRESRPAVAVPGLVRLERVGARRPAPGHRVPRGTDRDLDLRRNGPGLVLPPVLRLPTGPELGQSRGPGRDRQGDGFLATAGSIRVPRGCRAVRAGTGCAG